MIVVGQYLVLQAREYKCYEMRSSWLGEHSHRHIAMHGMACSTMKYKLPILYTTSYAALAWEC